jgi:hypothetical protein
MHSHMLARSRYLSSRFNPALLPYVTQFPFRQLCLQLGLFQSSLQETACSARYLRIM